MSNLSFILKAVMASIHDSSILYLINLANGLEQPQQQQIDNPLLKKIKTVEDCHKLDLRTVELVEKTLNFIEQAHSENQAVLDEAIGRLCTTNNIKVMTSPELLNSLEGKLTPMLEHVLGLKGKGIEGATLSEELKR